MKLNELRKICRRQSDYFFTILITNELSLLLTWLLLKTRITPNTITVMAIFSGVLCGIFYAIGNFWAGSFFMFFGHILDCTDGNLARAKNQFSPIGKWLDMIGDRLSHSFVLAGVSIYFFNQSNSTIWSYLALIDLILLLNYYYSVDIAIAHKLFPAAQKTNRFVLKGVPIRLGLYEPVIYGFVFLAPFGLIKIHLILILIFSLFGISFQFYTKFKFTENQKLTHRGP